MKGMINKGRYTQYIPWHCTALWERGVCLDMFGGWKCELLAWTAEITSVLHCEKHTGFAFICHMWFWLFTERQYRCEHVNYICSVWAVRYTVWDCFYSVTNSEVKWSEVKLMGRLIQRGRRRWFRKVWKMFTMKNQ